MATKQSSDEVHVPIGYPTSLIYMDESGSRASGDSFFVVAAVKVRHHGKFMRAVKDLRDKHDFDGEFKFGKITSGTLDVYYGLVDEIEKADINVAACVVDGATFNPFGGRPAWSVHAEISTQLLVGCINKRELVSVLMDGFSTPKGVAIDDVIMENVNRKLKSTSVVTAACLDSRTSDGLQVADLVAGAVAFERKQGDQGPYKPQTPKAKVANRLKAAFGGVGFTDCRSPRVNIQTYKKGKSPGKKGSTSPKASGGG